MQQWQKTHFATFSFSPLPNPTRLFNSTKTKTLHKNVQRNLKNKTMLSQHTLCEGKRYDCFFVFFVIILFTLCRNDKRFFIKTQSRHEVAFLLSDLERYAAYLEKYPHSLLVRFLGEKTATRCAKPGQVDHSRVRASRDWSADWSNALLRWQGGWM